MTEDRVYRNLRFREVNAFAGIAVFAVFYVVPGIVVGRLFREWVGFMLMAAGAALLLVFAWRCIFPPRIAFDRDGIRFIEGYNGRTFPLGYEKIHEARWEVRRSFARRIFGPVVFSEPLWPMQRKSDRRLVMIHGGHPIELREDEYGDLSELADALKKHRVPGFADEARRPMQTYGSGPA